MKLSYLFFLVVITAPSLAQTQITGIVKDAAGAAIPGANVFLLDTYDGASTDAGGKFQFNTDEKGPHTLVAKFVGYEDYTLSVILEGKPIHLQIGLKETINELQAVTITAGTFTASDENRRTIFQAQDIATTAGATADIAGALNTLPGTQKVGESGRLFVRGGDGTETRTFIDGMMVLDAYGVSAPNTPSRGRFLPFMFKGTSFSTGGYSAEYGQALSSALVLDSRDQAEADRTDFALMSVGADVSHTHKWDQASMAAKVQYTNIRPYFNLINQEIDWITPPASVEGSAVFRHQLGASGMLKVFGNFNHANYSLYNHDIDDPSSRQAYDLTNDYLYLNSAYKTAVGENWIVRGGVSYSKIKDQVVDVTERVTTDEGIHAKAVLEGNLSSQVEVKTGVEWVGHVYGQSVPAFQLSRRFRDDLISGFAEGDIYFSNRFVARLGGRMEYSQLQQTVSLDPRFSLAYQAGKDGTLSLSYGKFRQSAQSQYLLLDTNLQSEKSDHYIVSYQFVRSRRTFRAEVYYKDYTQLVKYGMNPDAVTNDGDGHAKGFELFWRDNQTFRNTDFWVSYSYLDTERNYLDYPHAAIPTFASAHNFSVVYKYFFTRLRTQAGATWLYSSGRPYNDPNQTAFNGGRTPSYQDLSVNFAYLAKHNLIVYFSATNVLGRDNIFGYEYGDELNEQGMYNSRAIRQPAPRFLFIGIFLTLSKDKTVNQLPAL